MLNRKYVYQDISIPAKSLIDCVPKWECHIHTSYTDGFHSVDEIVQKSINLGLELIIFTEHTEPWKSHREDWFSQYFLEIEAVKKLYTNTLQILCGIEAPATDYSKGLSLSQEMLDNVDLIVGTAHRYPGIENRRVQDMYYDELVEYEYRTLMALATNPQVDVIAHIGGTCKKYGGPFPENLTRAVIRAATQHGKIIEINNRYHEPLSRFVDLCVEENARVTLGSDVHSLDEVGGVYCSLMEMTVHSNDSTN